MPRAPLLLAAALLCGAAADEAPHHLLHDKYDTDNNGYLNLIEVKKMWNIFHKPNSLEAVDEMIECIEHTANGTVNVSAGAESVKLDDGIHKILLAVVQRKMRGTCLADTMNNPVVGGHAGHGHGDHDHDHHGHAHARGVRVLDEDGHDEHGNHTEHDHVHEHGNDTDHDHDHSNHTDHDHDHSNHTDHDHDHSNHTDHRDDHDMPKYIMGFVHHILQSTESSGFNRPMLTQVFQALVPEGDSHAGHSDHSGHDDHSGHAHARAAQTLSEDGHDHDHDHDHGHSHGAAAASTARCEGLTTILAEAGVANDSVRVSGATLVRAVEAMLLDAANNCTRPAEEKCSPPTRAERWGLAILATLLVTLLAAIVLIVVVPLVGVNKLVMELFLAFAIGALIGDSFLHIMPIALGVHGHGGGEDDHHGHEDETLAQTTIRGRMLVVTGTILAFYWVDFFSRGATGGKGHGHGSVDEKAPDSESPKQDVNNNVSDVIKVTPSSGHADDDTAVPTPEAVEKKNDGAWLSHTQWPAVVWVVLLADGVHNLTDGLSIGASFSKNTSLGWTTTLAMVLHEIPQEVGDFAILLAAGMPVPQAVLMNLLSGATSLLACIVAVAVAESTSNAEDWMLCVAAGSFVYLAVAVIAGELLEAVKTVSWVQFGLHSFGVVAGVIIMWAIAVTESHGECDGHGH